MLEPAGIAAGASSSAEVVAHALAALWQDGGQSVVGLEQIAEPVVALVAVLALRSAPAGLDTVCVGVVRLLTLLASVAPALVRFPAFGARRPCSRRPSFCFGGSTPIDEGCPCRASACGAPFWLSCRGSDAGERGCSTSFPRAPCCSDVVKYHTVSCVVSTSATLCAAGT